MKKPKTFRQEKDFPKSARLSSDGNYSIDDLMLDYAKYYHESKLKLLGLGDVSKQRELLIAFEKQRYIKGDWLLIKESCIKDVNDFLSNL